MPAVGHTLRLLLDQREDFSYSLHQVCTIGELQALPACLNPDIVFLDIRLPDGDGRDYIGWIRHHFEQPCYLAAFTVLSERQYRYEGLLEGLDAWIGKGSDLKVTLNQILDELAAAEHGLLIRSFQLPSSIDRIHYRLESTGTPFSQTERRLLESVVGSITRAGSSQTRRSLVAEKLNLQENYLSKFTGRCALHTIPQLASTLATAAVIAALWRDSDTTDALADEVGYSRDYCRSLLRSLAKHSPPVIRKLPDLRSLILDPPFPVRFLLNPLIRKEEMKIVIHAVVKTAGE